MKQILTLVIAILTVLLKPFEAFSEEIKVGVVLGFTGEASVWADYSRKGLELAASEVNKNVSLDGTTVKFIYEDSRSTSAGAVSAFKKLVHQDKVQVVVGDVWGFLTNPLIPLADHEKIVLISPTVMEGSVPESSQYFFSMGHQFESLRDPIEKFFALNPKIKKAGIIAFDDYWNVAFVKAVDEVAQKRGVKIVNSFKVNDFNPNFRTEVTAIRHSHAEMLLTTWKAEVALQRMKEQNFNVPYLSSSDAVEAFLFRSKEKSLFEGMYFIDWKPSAEFIRKFEAEYGKAPLYEAQNSYEIIRSLIKASESGDKDLQSALSKVEYEGVEGRINFRSSRFPNGGPARLYKVQNGNFVEQ